MLSPGRGTALTRLVAPVWICQAPSRVDRESRGFARRRPAELHPRALLTVLVAIGLAWISPFYALEAWRGARLAWDGPTLASLGYVGVMASVVAYLAWNQGVAELGAQRSGAFLHLLPAFTAVLAALLLGEAFHAYHAVGIGLVLLGVRVAGGFTLRR